jgi:hypothetical protein
MVDQGKKLQKMTGNSHLPAILAIQEHSFIRELVGEPTSHSDLPIRTHMQELSIVY